ncbi:2-iminobutanoate/2-iminopropanoate deaminase [Galendromus occidentalis]|uniref:2-iminobutanoate/2-iminopropanoate deaminase n=1 Tax=Galendromus occidentalis TaxID=34638 RepID=A0AAJ6QWH5_9ACAR|nr:2-iminobutanoate/2-iminopropanoate deaminase [Galendromus occidentalis]
MRLSSSLLLKNQLKMALTREVINIEAAPKPIGPYSHAVRLGQIVYTSGQVGSDPKTRTLVPGGIAEETRQALTNLRNILESAGSGLSSVAKCTVFLADMKEFADMNKVYAEFFPTQLPARSAFQVVELPMKARVEIQAVAAVTDLSKL